MQHDAETEAPAVADEERPGRALIYVRVSSAQQADKDYDAEGFSIPAQREACLRKAASLGAQVVEEFVDRGESARTANRAGLQALLTRLEQGDITHVIVHKVDRLARDRASDVAIVAKIRGSGAQLVSVTENIDETPSGILLHGIMSSIAEFYSRNLATEIIKGSTQKAKKGGAPFRAPLGYLNSRDWIDGREIRTITVDPERAPLVTYAFELYATGDYSLIDLATILEARGLRSRPSRNRPAKLLGTNRLSTILRNDFYTGVLRWNGITAQGRHEPIVDEATFYKVQDILDSQRQSGERSWRHHHYLRGTLRCAQCGRRLFFTRAKGRGGLYDYFICGGRTAHLCDQPHHRAAAVEAAIEHHYATIQLTDKQRQRVRTAVNTHITGLAQLADKETSRARAEVIRLDNEERKLLTAHYNDRISQHIFNEEQQRIRRERAAAERLLQRHQLNYDQVLQTLDLALQLTDDIQAAYLQADTAERRLLNQAFYESIEIDNEEITGHTLQQPFHTVATLARPNRATTKCNGTGGLTPRNVRTPNPSKVRGSYVSDVVERTGIEPVTSGLQRQLGVSHLSPLLPDCV
jgi:DNA invertase Pin-like site-specific DNA recombinase